MPTDTEIILVSLQKERDELHSRILQVDRIISRIKGIEYSEGGGNYPEQIAVQAKPEETPAITFPTSSDIKIQVLRLFDILGQAASLQQLQEEFTKITGNSYKIREAARALHNVGILKMIKYKNASRGFLWVKTEWIKDGALLDKYKPLGFDLLHKPENLIFQ